MCCKLSTIATYTQDTRFGTPWWFCCPSRGGGRFDESATWLDDLRPAFGQSKFFFEDELAVLEETSTGDKVSSGQIHPLPGPTVAPNVDVGLNINGGSYIAARGMCVDAGVGDMRYRNDVIPPRPSESGTSVQLFQQQ